MTTYYTTPAEITAELEKEIREEMTKPPRLRRSKDFYWSCKWLYENGYVTYWPVWAENGPKGGLDYED